MRIGFEKEQEAIAWCRKVIGLEGFPGFCRAISVEDDKGFVAVVALSNFTKRNVDLHIAARPNSKWFSADLFTSVFSYVFEKLGAARVTGLIRASNARCRKFVEHLGFKLEGTMRSAFPDDDLCIYGFLAEEYRAHPWRLNHV